MVKTKHRHEPFECSTDVGISTALVQLLQGVGLLDVRSQEHESPPSCFSTPSVRRPPLPKLALPVGRVTTLNLTAPDLPTFSTGSTVKSSCKVYGQSFLFGPILSLMLILTKHIRRRARAQCFRGNMIADIDTVGLRQEVIEIGAIDLNADRSVGL